MIGNILYSKRQSIMKNTLLLRLDIRVLTSCFLYSLLSTALVMPLTTHALSAKEIMQKVDDNARKSTANAFSRFKLSTCKYTIKDKRLRCTEKPRIKLVESAQINTGKNDKDSKSLAVILSPASEKGIGMLSYVYDDTARDNETWLYLSALGKIKRIAAGNSDDEVEPVAFFGSEITTEDMENGKLDDYSFKLVKETSFKGRDVYIVESTPTPSRLKKTRYAKTLSWIDAERFIVMKAQMFDKRGNSIKRIQVNKVDFIHNIWMSRSMTVMNLISKRLTNFNLDVVNLGVKIEPEFLTQRPLTDHAFREKHLNSLRKQTQ